MDDLGFTTGWVDFIGTDFFGVGLVVAATCAGRGVVFPFIFFPVMAKSIKVNWLYFRHKLERNVLKVVFKWKRLNRLIIIFEEMSGKN